MEGGETRMSDRNRAHQNCPDSSDHDLANPSFSRAGVVKGADGVLGLHVKNMGKVSGGDWAVIGR